MLAARREGARARGDARQAALLFQRAGFIKHAADAEIGLMRAYMQSGEYRRALAFAAHTAGAHPDPVGQGALRAAARSRRPDGDRRAPGQGAAGAIRAVQPGIRPPAERCARGIERRAAQRRAPALSRSPPLNEPLWVRNGLGALVPARVLRRIDELDLALLELERPLDGAALAAAPRDAFPGSPAFAVEYPASEDAAPAWPLLRVGFVGRKDLGIALPPGPRGGPVFDETAGWSAVALAERLVPVSLLRRSSAATLAEAAPQRITIEEIYERALAATLQVIAAPR